MIIVDVEYVGAMRIERCHRAPKQLLERVTRETHELPGTAIILARLGLVNVYYDAVKDALVFADRRIAWLLYPLLRWRDAAARSWVYYCRDLQLIHEGERAPWPRWLRFGW